MPPKTDFRRLESEILSQLDIAAEYALLGVRFASDAANPKGWRSCHAIDREDSSPSAAVNIESGYYRDLGGNGLACGLFDFAAKFGQFKSWREARRHYAKQCGLGSKLPKSDDPECPDDRIGWHSDSISTPSQAIMVRGFCRRYGVTPAMLRDLGCRIGRYPKDAPEPTYVIAFPAHGPTGLDEPPRGYIIAAADGRPIDRYRGEAAPEPAKRLVIGTTGLVGGIGLRSLSTAKLVIKTEGLTDMLAVQAAIPADRRDDIAVLTNACGTHETALATEVKGLFAGKEVWVIHDCDVPGQDGAALWSSVLASEPGTTVRNILLPYPVGEKKGADIRDWLTDGHTFADLENLAAATEPSQHTPGETLDHHRLALKKCGIVVLGHHDDKILAFSEHTGLTSELSGRSIDKLKLEHCLLHFGREMEQVIDISPEPDPNRVNLTQLRRAIAAEASVNRLEGNEQHGRGIWEFDGRAMLVGRREVLIVNGSVSRTTVPVQGSKVLDLGCSQNWYDAGKLERLLLAAKDARWRRGVWDELQSLFARWDNWTHPHDPDLVASLVMATWMQTVWQFRPICVVSGPTNSGKSWLFERVLAHFYGKLAIPASKPSEAGLRQTVGHDACILLVDEFEKSQHRQRVWELLRTGTSADGGAVLKGTSNQRGRSYRLRHMPWVGSIESGLTEAADRNRAILMELHKVESFEGRQRLTLPPPRIVRELGERSLAAILSVYRDVRGLAERLSEVDVGNGIDRRQVEAFALPVAVSAVMQGLAETDARERLVDWLKTRWEDEEAIVSDEDSLVEDLLDSEIYVSRDRTVVSRAIGKLLGATPPPDPSSEWDTDVGDGPALVKALQDAGMHLATKDDGSQVLHIAASGRLIQKLLNGSRWHGKKIGQILKRIPGVIRENQKYGKRAVKGYSIPVEQLPFEATEVKTKSTPKKKINDNVYREDLGFDPE